MTISTGVLSYPTPPYSNPPINPQFFLPSQFVISNITLGATTTITSILDMNYVIGQEIRLNIPPGYGCRQLNGAQGYVLSFPALNQVQVSIDSSMNVDPFISASLSNYPQIVAIGDINQGTTNSNGATNMGTFVPGAFINISPL